MPTKKTNSPQSSRQTVVTFNKEINKRLNNKLPPDQLFVFYPDINGPLSFDVFNAMDFLSYFNIIKQFPTSCVVSDEEAAHAELWISELGKPTEINETELMYILSPKGLAKVEDSLLPLMTKADVEILMRFKRRINTLSQRMVLNYLYQNYPEVLKKERGR